MSAAHSGLEGTPLLTEAEAPCALVLRLHDAFGNEHRAGANVGAGVDVAATFGPQERSAFSPLKDPQPGDAEREGSRGSAEATACAAGDTPVELALQADGTFCGKVCAEVPGRYRLDVTLNGEAIAGSPYKVEVGRAGLFASPKLPRTGLLF